MSSKKASLVLCHELAGTRRQHAYLLLDLLDIVVGRFKVDLGELTVRQGTTIALDDRSDIHV